MTEHALSVVQGYQLVATNEAELQSAHDRMIEWAVNQQARCTRERAEEQQTLDIARANKWAVKPHQRRISALEKRVTFYSKIEQALRAGYVIVPNFDMTLFGIRVKEDGTPRLQTRMWHINRAFNERGRMLPAGEGEYVNPDIPAINETDYDGDKEVKSSHSDDEYQDVEFPIALAKPEIMSRAAEAMALKLFDEVGVAEDARSGRGDPIILGRIRNPRESRPDITFFIAWYFDPERL